MYTYCAGMQPWISSVHFKNIIPTRRQRQHRQSCIECWFYTRIRFCVFVVVVGGAAILWGAMLLQLNYVLYIHHTIYTWRGTHKRSKIHNLTSKCNIYIRCVFICVFHIFFLLCFSSDRCFCICCLRCCCSAIYEYAVVVVDDDDFFLLCFCALVVFVVLRFQSLSVGCLVDSNVSVFIFICRAFYLTTIQYAHA